MLKCWNENLAENFAFCCGLYLRADFAVVDDNHFTRWTDNIFVDICRSYFIRIFIRYTLF